MLCRHCHTELRFEFVDLGTSPPSNAYLSAGDLKKPEKWFPLRVLVCDHCWMVQTEDFTQANELFDSQYAYFSAVSTSWLKHCKRFVAEATERFGLTRDSHVVEVAANDGYLLQFVKELGIPCTGIEPTESTANVARNRGIEIVQDFFGTTLASKLASEGKQADLTIANNVLAHVPDINDFVRGFSVLLKSTGIATFEFPHLLRLIEQNQFDTIYHEHFSYLSLTAIKSVFEKASLEIFDVEELPTHGGSLRLFVQKALAGRTISKRVSQLLQVEEKAGLRSLEFYRGFQPRVERVKHDLLKFLVAAKDEGKKVVGYGAAAKGNTLLNYSGVRSDLLSFVVDKSPSKQGKFLPGSRIPILSEESIGKAKPDYVLILPWNLEAEIVSQLSYVKEWQAKFVRAIPRLEIIAT